MKRNLLLCILGCLTLITYAQPKQLKFRPDWCFEVPRPENATYFYAKETGEGLTKSEAMNQAMARVFFSTANRLGQPISTASINDAVQKGESYEVIARTMNIPVNKVCDFFEQNEKDNSWTCYVLCQVAKDAITDAMFEPFDKCRSHAKFDEIKASIAKQDSIKKVQEQNAQKKVNARAIAASTFIPGVGQMLKGHGGAGFGFLLSELALFGGGTACYFIADKQNNLMMQRDISYDDYINAMNLKKTHNIAMYCCFGAGAALHIVNMCHAYLCSDKKLTKTLSAFEPTIIPINEYSQPNYALGISWHHDF